MNDYFIEIFLKITSKVINSRNKLQNLKKRVHKLSFICKLSVKYDVTTILDCIGLNIRVAVMQLSKQTKISYFCIATRLEMNHIKLIS